MHKGNIIISIYKGYAISGIIIISIYKGYAISGIAGETEKVGEKAETIGGDDAFGMKLEAEDGVMFVTDRHYIAVFIAGGDFQRG